MEIISKLFKIRSLIFSSMAMLTTLFFSSCEEQIDDLWDADGDSQAAPRGLDEFRDDLFRYAEEVRGGLLLGPARVLQLPVDEPLRLRFCF